MSLNQTQCIERPATSRTRMRLFAGLLGLVFLSGMILVAVSAGADEAHAAGEPPVWVNALNYGSVGGGFYWDFTSGQVWTAERGWHLYSPQSPSPTSTLWVNYLTYGSAGGGFYLDPLSGQVWTAERGWHLFSPQGAAPANTPTATATPTTATTTSGSPTPRTSTPTPTCEPAANQVALYTGVNNTGTCVLEGVGDYPDIAAAGFPNDALQSAKLGSGVHLDLFADPAFAGASSVHSTSFNNLTGDAVGPNRTSSFKVGFLFATGCVPLANEVALFVEINFGGQCAVRGIGDYTDLSVFFPNDKLASAKLGSAAGVILYADANFQGDTSTHVTDFANLTGDPVGPNRMSSFRVMRRGCNIYVTVALFTDVNHGGVCVERSFGEYANADTGGFFPDNGLDSAFIAPGVRLVLYSEPNFGGASSTHLIDFANLAGDPVGPKHTSSFKVVIGTTGCVPASDEVALFVEDSFQGNCVVRGIGDYANIGAGGFFEDNALASMKIGSAVKVIIYADLNFGGSSSTHTGDVDGLINDPVGYHKASSFKVQAK